MRPSGREPRLCPHTSGPRLSGWGSPPDQRGRIRPRLAAPGESGFSDSSLSRLRAPGFTCRPHVTCPGLQAPPASPHVPFSGLLSLELDPIFHLWSLCPCWELHPHDQLPGPLVEACPSHAQRSPCPGSSLLLCSPHSQFSLRWLLAFGVDPLLSACWGWATADTSLKSSPLFPGRRKEAPGLLLLGLPSVSALLLTRALYLWPPHVCRFPPQPATPAGCPTIQPSSNSTHPEIAQIPRARGSLPRDCPFPPPQVPACHLAF